MSGSRGASGHGRRWQKRNDMRALLRHDVAKAVHHETAALREMLRQDSTTQTKLLELLGQMHAEIIAELSKTTLRLDNLSSGRVPNTFGSIGCTRNDAGGWEAESSGTSTVGFSCGDGSGSTDVAAYLQFVHPDWLPPPPQPQPQPQP